METRRIRFSEDVKVRNREGSEFKKGQIYELRLASANRWVLRGKAENVADEKADVASNAPAMADDAPLYEATAADVAAAPQPVAPAKGRPKKTK